MTTTITLSCLILEGVLDRNDIFIEKVAPTSTVDELRNKIIKEHVDTDKKITSKAITLYRVKHRISTENEDEFNTTMRGFNIKTAKEQGLVEVLSPDREWTRIGFAIPEVDTLHILAVIKLPVDPTNVGVNRSHPDPAYDIVHDVVRAKKPRVSLPSLDMLPDFLDTSLQDNEKVPITQNEFNALVFMGCHPGDVSILFRISETEWSATLFTLFYGNVARAIPPAEDGSESSFISFWDDNLRKILELYLPSGKSIRNSIRDTSTRLARPDYSYLYGHTCPFRKEEKPPHSKEDPRAELIEKLEWTYNPAPYVFGSYSYGTKFTLSAICAPKPGKEAYVHDLCVADLRQMRERILSARRIINLCCLIPPLVDLIGFRAVQEFVPLDRGDKIIEIGGLQIKKTYCGDTGPARVSALREIYRVLKLKGVPNIDELVFAAENVVYLKPKGVDDGGPIDETETFEAVACVLEALQVLHQDPQILHRDIRWPNVMRSSGDPTKWFLIDFDDACSGQHTKAANHLSQHAHCPLLRQDNHGPEVDLWGVGFLLTQPPQWCKLSPGLQDIGKKMQDYHFTAVTALGAIREYQSTIQQAASLKS